MWKVLFNIAPKPKIIKEKIDTYDIKYLNFHQKFNINKVSKFLKLGKLYITDKRLISS